MNVLILHGEPSASKRLAGLIKEYDRSINILCQLDSIKDGLAFFEGNPQVDLIFLDVRLPDGLTFDIFQKAPLDQPVIFTSEQDGYALEAFKFNAVDYLLKPIDYDGLAEAIDKYKRLYRYGYRSDEEDKNVYNTTSKEIGHQYKKRFIVKFGDHIQFKTTENIAYFFAENKVVYAVTKGNNRRYIVEYILDELDGKYLDPDYFFRINRKFIVQIDAIEDVRNYLNSRLKLKVKPACEMDMVVSREKVNDFKAWLDL